MSRVKAVPHYRNDPGSVEDIAQTDYAKNVFEVLWRKGEAREWREATNANRSSSPIATTRL